MKKITAISIIAVMLLSFGSTATAQLSILRPSQGGTGIGSATAADVNKCLTVSDDSPFTFILGACGSGGFAYPFSNNATSTTLGFFGGLLSTASSTFTTAPTFSSLSGILQGNGSSALTAISNSSTIGQVLRVTGASTYAWGALDLADGDAITGTLGVANGGTGITSFAAGIATWLGSGSAADLRTLTTGTTGSGNLVFATAPTLSGVTTDTLDTGQGANELYDMDQNVLTTSNVIFANATTTNATSTNSFFSLKGDFTTLCIAQDCKTAWPASAGANSKWATSTDNTSISPNGAFMVGIGTSTPGYTLQSSTSTGKNLALTNGGTEHWLFSARQGLLSVGTSSPTTYATSSPTRLLINFVTGLVTIKTLMIDDVMRIPNSTSIQATAHGTGGVVVDLTSDQFKYKGNGTGENVIVPFYTMVAGHATSTWSGTTTIFMAPAMDELTVTGVYCETDVGTVAVSLYDGTNRANYIPTASTTKNFFGYSTNNAFTAGESIRVDMGSPASSPTKASCRFKYTYDSD